MLDAAIKAKYNENVKHTCTITSSPANDLSSVTQRYVGEDVTFSKPDNWTHNIAGATTTPSTLQVMTSDGKTYSFTMPDEDVSITITTKPVPLENIIATPEMLEIPSGGSGVLTINPVPSNANFEISDVKDEEMGEYATITVDGNQLTINLNPYYQSCQFRVVMFMKNGSVFSLPNVITVIPTE